MVVELNYLNNLLKPFKSDLSNKPVAAIHGFTVDSNLAQLIKYLGYKVLAVSDKKAGLVDYGGNGGLDVFALSILKKRRIGFNKISMSKVKNTKPEFLVKLEVDLLIVHGRAVITEENADEIRARIVLKTSGASITRGAEEIMAEKQVKVISFYP